MSDSTIPTANTESNILQSQQRLPFLRRCSISDPRLDILPQNFSPEKGLNPFNRVLSGLFEGSTFSLSKFGSTDSVDKEGHQPKPASQEHLTTTPKLATSSATDLKNSSTNTEGGVLRKSVSALFGSSPQHHQHFPAIPETSEDQGGLTMSAKPTTSFTNANQSTNTQSAEASSPQKSGGFMKMFGTGGFLSRPVLHSPEEQYRYMMALDR